MAFPQTAAPTVTNFANATAHLVTMPATVDSGDLLVALISNDGGATVTTPSGWTQLFTNSGGGANRFGAYYKIADGTEDGTTVDFVTSVSETMAAEVYRVTAWHGTTPPEAGTPATSTGVSADPPSLTPSWGADDTLWLAGFGTDAGSTASAYPTNYTDGVTATSGGAGPCGIGSARRELNATSDDPAVFTITSAPWIANLLAIRPAAGGGPTTVTPAVDAVTTTLPTPTILAAANLAPAVIPLVASLPTPLIAAAATVTPAVIAVVATLPTPSISVGAVAAPAVIAVTTTLPTPSVLAASKVTPAVIPLIVTLPTPLAGAPTIVSPAVVAVTASLPTPSILAGAKVLPAVIPLAVLLPTPTATDSASSVVTPAVIAVTVGLPTPSVTLEAVVTPAGIAVVATVPMPGVTTPGLVTPAGISLVVTLPTPLATVGAITFWEKDPVNFVKIGPGDQPPWN